MVSELTSETATARRKRVPKREARERLIQSTITLLRVLPFDEVTNQTICAEADLNPSTILQHFGTLDKLLGETALELVKRHLAKVLSADGYPTTFADPDVELRNRLVAWLLLNGDDPEQYRSHLLEDEVFIEFQKLSLQVDQRAAKAWTTVTTMLIEAYSVFKSTHAMSDEELSDVLYMIVAMRADLPSIERTLGWAPGE